jgi:mannose-6-phosphate isomerase
MYPIRFEPIYRDYAWGGSRIAQVFHRKVDKPRVAESWELSDRDEGMSVVMNGPLKGKTLHQLMVEMGEELLGVGRKFDRFPLLLKIIDAKENLSVQVCPDEDVSTEMWVILENGTVYAGLKKDVTEKDLLRALKANKVEEILERVDLKKGEAVFIPGGRVHAICAGSLLYEIQQNGNAAYRLYDWERTGRALQVKEGMSAIHWNDKTPAKITPRHLSSDLKHQLVVLIYCPFFSVERIDVFNAMHIAAIPKSFQCFFCMEGKGKIIVDEQSEPFEPGMTYLVPAGAKSINFEGRCQMLRTRLS